MFRSFLTRSTQTLLVSVMLTAAICAQAPATADKQTEVFGQKIHYLEAGSGPTVILLHGLGGDVTNWALTLPTLAKDYHVFAIDQIGFGKSDKPLMNYRIGTMVDFVPLRSTNAVLILAKRPDRLDEARNWILQLDRPSRIGHKVCDIPERVNENAKGICAPAMLQARCRDGRRAGSGIVEEYPPPVGEVGATVPSPGRQRQLPGLSKSLCVEQPDHRIRIGAVQHLRVIDQGNKAWGGRFGKGFDAVHIVQGSEISHLAGEVGRMLRSEATAVVYPRAIG